MAINALFAGRMAGVTLMGRNTPQLSPETFFPEIEIAALDDFARDRRLTLPDNLGRAVRTLDGCPNFKPKQNAHPDHQVIRDGYVWLVAITQAPEQARRLNETASRYQKLRPIKICVLGADPGGSASSVAE